MNFLLSDLDKKILDILQNDFPICAEPYKAVASELNICEEHLLQRIKEMKQEGIIRRIGGVIDSKKMGYYSTLCACRVPQDRIAEVAKVINAENSVTHNYIREHYYNLWFTITAPSYDDALGIINNIQSITCINIIKMPAKRVYKIRVTFEMGEKSGG